MPVFRENPPPNQFEDDVSFFFKSACSCRNFEVLSLVGALIAPSEIAVTGG